MKSNMKKSRISLLFVEDEGIIRDSLKRFFERRFDVFYMAVDGCEGLEIFKTHRPQIVVTDIEMPCMNGLEMCKEIKEIDPSAFFLIISAHSDTSYLLQAIELGVTQFANKPILKNQLVGMLDDVLHQIDIQSQLHDLMENLQLAQKVAQMGSWNLRQDGALYWSEQMYHLLGAEPRSNQADMETWLSHMPDSDAAELKSRLEAAMREGKGFTLDHLLRRDDGSQRIIEQRCEVREGGVQNELIGTAQDVTEQMVLRQELSQYFELIDQSVITSTTDAVGAITYASSAFCQISGYTKEELLGQQHNIVRHPDMPKELYEEMWSELKAFRKWTGEIKNRCKDGSHYWVIATIFPIFDVFGRHIGYTAVRQDVTDKKRIEELSVTDHLTQLYNRLKLDEIFDYELGQTVRYSTPFSVIILDIDHFKSVNDQYGHHVGDLVLQEIASLLRENVRTTDTAGRWGGEEFLILLPKSTCEDAYILAEKLRKAVENYTFTEVGKKTASFGVSEYQAGDTEETLVDRADQALYEAKNSGRNRVVKG